MRLRLKCAPYVDVGVGLEADIVSLFPGAKYLLPPHVPNMQDPSETA